LFHLPKWKGKKKKRKKCTNLFFLLRRAHEVKRVHGTEYKSNLFLNLIFVIFWVAVHNLTTDN
jgi:hypothetical protein